MYEFEERLSHNWRLYISENKDCVGFAGNINDEAALIAAGIECIPATVPGNFELDMQRAGMIDDPFFGKNPLEIQKLENRHLWYAVEFDYSGTDAERAYLRFDGIDTFSDVYLNGKHIGATDNMLIPYEFRADGIKKENNRLLVHIKPTVIEAGKFDFDLDVISHMRYNAAALSVRKAAHSFGWDIMPRFISGGIWRDCFITEKKADYIDDIYLSTVEISKGRADIIGKYSTVLSGDFSTEYSLKIEGECGEHKFSHNFDKLWHNKGVFEFEIYEPELWRPRDIGEQKLYRVKATLLHNGEQVDVSEFNFGIRTVKLEKSDVTDSAGSGEFCFYVNGEHIYIRGTNWVPMDAFHSRDSQRLDRALDMLLDINCNAVRCWGGNVYEDHAFFDFCDKHGILVWQDFAMGCATYPQNEEFLAKLKEEAEIIVKKLRRHPSLAIWAGDNECDESAAYWKPSKKNPNRNKATRKVLPEVLERLDPYREYLPSSPYVSEKAYLNGNHDVLPEAHLWGPRDYFKGKYYTSAAAHFVSEIGYHGCPSPESIKKFISSEKLWPWRNNDEWQIHSSCMELGNNVPYAFRNGLMANQIKVLFGEEPDTLETFSLASQLSQAEAVKFFIENFRSHKWRRTGLIWWNLIDGWPQISDAIVDYYYDRKKAYYFIKRSQEPVALMMREPEYGFLSLVAANEYLECKQIKYRVTDLSSHHLLFDDTALINANSVTELKKLPYDEKSVHFYLMEWESDGKKGKNHYISGTVPYDFDKYLKWLMEAELI